MRPKAISLTRLASINLCRGKRQSPIIISFETLAREGVNVEMISAAQVTTSVIADLAKGKQARKASHRAFIAG